jgi:hypothetical protein
MGRLWSTDSFLWVVGFEKNRVFVFLVEDACSGSNKPAGRLSRPLGYACLLVLRFYGRMKLLIEVNANDRAFTWREKKKR